MKHSMDCVDLIKRFEGFAALPYKCPAGKLTIGYGHVIGANESALRDVALGEAQATKLLEADLARFSREVYALTGDVKQGQFDALVSFAYNAGVGALRGSTLLKKLRAGDASGAAMEFDRWVHGGGKRLPGLVTRRAAERALFEGGRG